MLIKEIKDIYRFFKETDEKEIVFYAEHEGYYPYFEGLIHELINIHKKTISYITSDPGDPVLFTSNPDIKTFYINNFLAFFMPFLRCRLFIMTLTDLHRFHLKRSIHPVHYCYVPHSMCSTHSYRYGSFDYYDSILCTGPHQLKEFRKHEELQGLPVKELVEAGYYRLERIYDKYQTYLSHGSLKEKTTVLIAPTLWVNNILEYCGENLVGLLLDHGYEVIVRPHPEIIRHSPGLINNLARRFGKNPFFILEKSISTDTSLLKSDILICDRSGIALEYALGTERPVIFLDVPYKLIDNKSDELNMEPLELSIREKVGLIVSPERLDTIPTVIEHLKSHKMKYKALIPGMRKEYVYNFGFSSCVGAKHIIAL
jgi:YidC/Oxa1 family membrane protein insertase